MNIDESKEKKVFNEVREGRMAGGRKEGRKAKRFHSIGSLERINRIVDDVARRTSCLFSSFSYNRRFLGIYEISSYESLLFQIFANLTASSIEG